MPLELSFDGTSIWAGDALVMDHVPSNVFVSTIPQGAPANSILLGLGIDQAPTSRHEADLGRVKSETFLACARNKLFWMVPEFCSSTSKIPPETQYILAELASDNLYAAFIPMIDNNTFRATFRPSRLATANNNHLCLQLDSGNIDITTNIWHNALLIAVGDDPYPLVDQAVSLAASLSGGAKPRWEKKLPEIVDLFGWCTWDAFYSSVSAQGVQAGMHSLAAGGCAPKFLIIDDGWQQTGVDPAYAARDARSIAEFKQLATTRHVSSVGNNLSNANGATPATRHASSVGNGATPAIRHASSMGDDVSSANGATAATSLKHLQLTSGAAPEGNGAASVVNGSGSAEGSPTILAGGDSWAPGVTPTTSPAPTKLTGVVGHSAISGLIGNEEQVMVNDAELALAPSRARPAPSGVLGGLLSAVMPTPVLRLLGSLYGWGEAQLLQLCNSAIAASRPDSFLAKLVSAGADGPLRDTILRFYAATGDHVKRLTSPACNGKFTSLTAGPEDVEVHGQDDFAGVVAALRKRYGVRYVYCWHAVMGYWCGVSPHDPDFARLSPRVLHPRLSPQALELDRSLAWNQQVLAGVALLERPEQLYQMLHGYLASVGIDGVKVDSQSTLGMLGSAVGAPGGPALVKQYQDALEASVAEHFPGNHCINCMSHSSENMFRMRETAIARVSDDFYPRDAASHTTHVAVCAYNSLFFSPLVVPDWDMFHSKHPRALLHATARVVSGGPVYVSDRPGHHDFALLRRLVLPDGSVLRPLLPGRPTRDCLFKDTMRDGRTLLKVWTRNRFSGVLGVFHVQGSHWDRVARKFVTHDAAPPPLTTSIRTSDVEDLNQVVEDGPMGGGCAVRHSGRFAVYSDRLCRLHVMDSSDKLQVRLKGGESDLLTVAPVLEVRGTPCHVEFAAVGIIDMLNAGGTICSLEVGLLPQEPPATSATSSTLGPFVTVASPHATADGPTTAVDVSLRGSGTFLMYCSLPPRSATLNGRQVAVQYDAFDCSVAVQVPAAEAVRSALRFAF